MIASVFVVGANPLGLFALLPLVGIYPITAAIIGSDPIDVIYNSGQVQTATEMVPGSAQVETLYDEQTVKQSPQHHHDKAA